MKIIQIPRRFTRNKWGGTESVVLETCKRLRARGHDTSILTTQALDEGLSEDIQGVPVERTAYFYPYLGLSQEARHRLDLKAGNLFSFELLRKLWSQSDLDLIHLHTGKRLGAIGRYVARSRKIPYVVSLHGGCYVVPPSERSSWQAPTTNSLEWGKLLGWWFGSRRVLDDASAILCLSQEEVQEVRSRLPDKRVLLLPNGVDCSHYAQGDGARFRQKWNINPHARILLNVGRIDAQKNQIGAVRVLQDLLARGHDTHLVLIGPCTDPSYEEQLTQEIQTHGLEGRVTLTGGIPASGQEIVDAYHSAEVFLLPSRHEPFGIVILEAWAAGLPVVASSVGGIPDLISSSALGGLFDPTDLAGAVAACEAFLNLPARAKEVSSLARDRVRREFDWENVTSLLEGVYRDVIAEGSRSRSSRKSVAA